MEYIEILIGAILGTLGGTIATYFWSIPKKKLAAQKAEKECFDKMQKEQNEKLASLEYGMQSLLRSEVQAAYMTTMARGYTYQYEKNNVGYLYKAYTMLGGNSYICKLYEQIMNAPIKEEE